MTSISTAEANSAERLLAARSAKTAPLYTATVAMTTRGLPEAPASGRVVSDDGALALVVQSPTDSSGRGGGTSAEQLLAAGLAASFDGALRRAALAKNIRLMGSIDIIASVHLASDALEDGMFLSAELEVALPPLPSGDARLLMFEAERTCPYAKMSRSGIRSSFILR